MSATLQPGLQVFKRVMYLSGFFAKRPTVADMNRLTFLSYLSLAILLVGVTGCGESGRQVQPSEQSSGPAYVGAAVCAGCHEAQAELWRSSHHDLSMQPAGEASVLGDFDHSEFTHQGVTTRFYRRDNGYFVETDGQDGQLQEFPVRHAFGVEPLQQYLLELPGGGIQVLGVSWDSRVEEAGGQRWFHVYGDDAIDHNDVLHWTRPSQNWDSMCAYCHSTDLQKTFDLATKTFATTWSEINVSCEACHGSGSGHVEWAEAGGQQEQPVGEKGFAVSFDERDGVSWMLDSATGNSRRNRPRDSQVEIDTCAACHARRSQIDNQPQPGTEFLNAFRPALIQPPLYHVDGQIRDEVYVYGSFLQSRMYQQGVTCSDCHEPHSLELRAPGSEVCLQCHAADTFATVEHQLHADESAGADCIGCHMPATTYMQVDPRHDHSFRIPRPDLAQSFGTPDACTNCHEDRNADWAVEVLRKNDRLPAEERWQDQFARIQSGQPGARVLIAELSVDQDIPAIIRASVIIQAPVYGDVELIETIAGQAGSPEPLVRWAVARALQTIPAPLIARVAPPLLEDPIRAVRIEAANSLAPVDLTLLPAHSQGLLQKVLDEYVAAELVSNERAEAHANLGNLQRKLSRVDRAEKAYWTAIDLNPFFVPAYINLADLYREQEREADSEAVLGQALELLPEQPALHYSLGLSLFRQGRAAEARQALQTAAASNGAEPRMALAYALILDAQGETEPAIEYLLDARQRFGNDPGLLSALINLYQRTNRQQDAEPLIRQLRNL
jgi:predicted CXXCH cytochrome family protein